MINNLPSNATGIKVELIIGITKRNEGALVRLLTDLKIAGQENLTYIILPEELVGEESNF